jgi:DNA-directed RNA polymerase subunit RPC12/RpoP
MDFEQTSEYPAYILPHAEFGDPECCGLFFPEETTSGDAAITCNECGFVVKTVTVYQLQKALDEMQLKVDVASAQCPECGQVNLFPGFSQMMAYTCRYCGKAIRVEQ